MVKELIYCLVLLWLTAVLWSIYRGFLTAKKGTMDFTKDCTGNRFLLLNVPWCDQVILGRSLHVFKRHLKLIKELWLELIWCFPYECSACGLASVHETIVNTNMCAWINSFWPSHITKSQIMIHISEASSTAHTSVSYLHGPAVDCAMNYTRQWYWCSIDLY